MLAWRNGDSEGYTDLANDLWVRVLESPTTQRKLDTLNNNEVVATLKIMAQQLLSDQQGELNVFREVVMYSSDNVKDALKGKSDNKYLISVLPKAVENLAGRNQGYAAAIESRYLNKIVPKSQSAEQVLLSRAVKSLTEIVNALCIANTQRDDEGNLTVKDGPGSKAGKFPQDGAKETEAQPIRRGKGGHSDPVAAQALALLSNPEIEDELLYLEPITEWTNGPRPVIQLGDGRQYRLSSEEARIVKEHPSQVIKVIQKVMGRLC